MITDENYENPWQYNGSRFSIPDEELENYVGFVYIIQGLGKYYIGQKLLWGKKPKSRAKSAPKRQKRIIIPSDWKNYYGSSLELNNDVQKYGKDKFTRTIIYLCKSKGEMNYRELREQIITDSLLRDDSYNSFVGGKIHRKHIEALKIDSKT